MNDGRFADYAAEGRQHWSRVREAGTLRGMQFLFWAHRTFGRWIFSAMMVPVMIYFMLFRGLERRASLQFLRMVHQVNAEHFGRRPGYGQVLQHFIQFGEAILDKVLAWSQDMSEADFNPLDRPALDQLLADERGQLIIGSHLGNIEYCRGFMQRYRAKVVNALVYDHHATNFAEIMQQINPASRINLYQVDQISIPVVLELKAKIDRGEWLVIAGDRVPLTGEARSVEVEFLGRKALFPIGPYVLAQTLQCPVTLMFSYRSDKRVDVEFFRLAERIMLPRKGRASALAEWAQRYADRLQLHVLKAPLQWFNFYDFWARGVARQQANAHTTLQNTQ